jgi:hypothetical protein
VQTVGQRSALAQAFVQRVGQRSVPANGFVGGSVQNADYGFAFVPIFGQHGATSSSIVRRFVQLSELPWEQLHPAAVFVALPERSTYFTSVIILEPVNPPAVSLHI